VRNIAPYITFVAGGRERRIFTRRWRVAGSVVEEKVKKLKGKSKRRKLSFEGKMRRKVLVKPEHRYYYGNVIGKSSGNIMIFTDRLRKTSYFQGKRNRYG
jgi:hypothetical protein